MSGFCHVAVLEIDWEEEAARLVGKADGLQVGDKDTGGVGPPISVGGHRGPVGCKCRAWGLLLLGASGGERGGVEGRGPEMHGHATD